MKSRKILALSMLVVFLDVILYSQPINLKVGKYVDVKEAKIQSAYNKGEENGRKLGYDQGYEDGKYDGYANGESDGFEKGFIMGRAFVSDSILSVIHDNYFNPNPLNCGKLYDLVQEKFRSLENLREDLKKRYFTEGERIGYTKGFRAGLELNFDSTYSLQLMKGQNINFSEKARNYPFSLDYEAIARLLGTMDEKANFVEKKFFADAFYNVNIAVLEYLTGIVDLTGKEKAEVFKRYGEIHYWLAGKSYEQYRLLCNSLNRNYDKNFYNFQYSVSTEAFLDVVLFNIAAIADITFTYAKSNSQYAAWAGFELGHVSEILLTRIMVPLVDYFRKNAILLDYNAHFPQLEQVIVSNLAPIISETRSHVKSVQERVILSNDHFVDITMEIETYLEVGYFLDDFSIVSNHQDQIVWVFVSNKPRIMKVKQTYKVLDVFNTVEFGNRCYFNTDLSQEILDGIFRSHLDPVASLSISQKALSKTSQKILEPLLIKALESSVAIPYSCYQVNLDFGGDVSRLIMINCP